MCTLNYPSIRTNLLNWVVCIHRFLDYSIELHLFHFYVKILQEPHHSLVQSFMEGYGPCKIVLSSYPIFPYFIFYHQFTFNSIIKWKCRAKTICIAHIVVVDVAIVHIEPVGIVVVEIRGRQRPNKNQKQKNKYVNDLYR